MKKRGKKYQEVAKLIDKDKSYTLEEAIELAKKTSTSKFPGSLEMHLKLGINPKKSDQQLRGTISLPHGTGKTKKIIAITENTKEALDAGATAAGTQELIDEIKKTGKCDYDVVIAEPEMMKNLAQIARILGPRGIMPSPKNDTVTKNIKQAIEELNKGKISYKNDDTANLHIMIGKLSFETKQLIENYQEALTVIKKAKPASAKGSYIKNISLSATMGPGIKIQL